MGDIVDRLRSRAKQEHEMLGDIHIPLFEAADEIEELRTALMSIYKLGLCHQNGAYKAAFYNCFRIARVSLGIPHMSFDAARAALERK